MRFPKNTTPTILDTIEIGDIKSSFFPAEALVVDIITNEEHPEYNASGTKVGRAKIKFFTQINDPQFHYAYPLDTVIQEYPLINEVVIVYRIQNTLFYTKKVNLISNLKESQVSDVIRAQLDTRQQSNKNENVSLVSKGGLAQNQEIETTEFQFREVNSLKHHEGDVLLQSRFGATIRMGSNLSEAGLNQDTFETNIPSFKKGVSKKKTVFVSYNKRGGTPPLPNIILRTYQNSDIKTVDTPYGLTMEDIDKDASSLYMLTDQTQKLTLATSGFDVHAKSVVAWPELEGKKWTGAQILMNSNRLIFNARKERIILSAKGGINMMSATDATIDTNKDFISWVGKDYGLTVGTDYIVHIGNDSSIFTQTDMKIGTGGEFNLTTGTKTILQSGENTTIRSGKDLILSGGRVLLGDGAQINSNFESIALAETLATFLSSVLMTFIQNAYAIGFMGFGIPIPINPAILAQLVALQASLAAGPPFASTVVRAQRSL